jgi:hypothetical protein
MDRLQYIRREINNLYKNVSNINIENIYVVKSKYLDLNIKLKNTNFFIFENTQKHQLLKKMKLINQKIIEIEFEEDALLHKKSLQYRL